jgi:acetate kinase
MAEDLLLALNAGSSSVKLGLFQLRDDGRAIAVGRGELDPRGSSRGIRLSIAGHEHRWPLPTAPSPTTLGGGALARVRDDLQALIDGIEGSAALGALRGVAHRIVHGGRRFAGPVVVDDGALAAMRALVPVAPLHQPIGLGWIDAVSAVRPALVQTASFDTVFHLGQETLVRRFALPRALHDQGIERYGFHGLSYRFVCGELVRQRYVGDGSRIVVAHLGSGASLCAIRGGQSVDTSMGFSVLDGVPMGTRCGALDPGVVLHLLRDGMEVGAIEELLYRRSGLLGVSGISADVRELEASADRAADEALALFALRCAGECARLAATLGGLDTLVFTGGIGEHSAGVRRRICDRLGWLGVTLDQGANERGDARIAAPASRVDVRVIATDEAQAIADDAARLLASAGPDPRTPASRPGA